MLKRIRSTSVWVTRWAMTMVVVSHELRVASSILMMDEGKVVEKAPPDRFFASPSHERRKRFLALID